MKRFLLTALLLCASVLMLRAQNMSSLSKASLLAYNYLSNEGYKPYIDEDNDVCFKAQGYTFYVDNYSDDDTYLRLVLSGIKVINTEENVMEALVAHVTCNEINKNKKLIKAYMSDDGHVSLSTQTYLGNCSDVSEFIDTSINFMISAASSWYETFNELSSQ